MPSTPSLPLLPSSLLLIGNSLVARPQTIHRSRSATLNPSTMVSVLSIRVSLVFLLFSPLLRQLRPSLRRGGRTHSFTNWLEGVERARRTNGRTPLSRSPLFCSPLLFLISRNSGASGHRPSPSAVIATPTEDRIFPARSPLLSLPCCLLLHRRRRCMPWARDSPPSPLIAPA